MAQPEPVATARDHLALVILVDLLNLLNLTLLALLTTHVTGIDLPTSPLTLAFLVYAAWNVMFPALRHDVFARLGERVTNSVLWAAIIGIVLWVT